MVYYRSDLLDKDGLKPPQTWDDYIAIAKKYQGQDLNGDGKPDYGSCIAKKRAAQSYWAFWSVAAGFLQSQGTSQGSFFDAGTKKVLDRASGKLVDCNSTLCPNAINGVNHAPFAAYGGWSGAINANIDPKVKEAAYAFLAYVGNPTQSNTDVTIGKTGFNPYR